MQTTANSRNSNSRHSPALRQIAGPLDGYRLGTTDVPVRTHDLSLDGCLVELGFDTLSGKDIRLHAETRSRIGR